MNNKVLIRLYIPALDCKYDVWIPINKKIYTVITLLIKAVNELSGGYYRPSKMPVLYDKITSREYDLNSKVKDVGIKNGAEVILN